MFPNRFAAKKFSFVLLVKYQQRQLPVKYNARVYVVFAVLKGVIVVFQIAISEELSP